MTSRTDNSPSQNIPLNKLKKSPSNVRSIPHSHAHIEALADSMEAHGQIHNLLVETELDAKGRATGSYLVTAGEGRRLAQLLRVKRKQIKATEMIRCVIDDTHNANALSLAENLHEQMHPADQFEAFKRLIDSGQSLEEVAGQFGVTPLVVQRRLKLANVAPEFLALCRQDEINLDHLMAFALTDDHEMQRQAWTGLPNYNRSPEALRRALTDRELSVSEAIVKFVGLKAYEKAGGAIRRDLFADDQHEGFVIDPELLRKLAAEKLEKAATQLKKDGAAWVEVMPELDYSTLSTFGRVRYVAREASAKEQAKLDKLKKQLSEIERQAQVAEDDEDRCSELADRADEIDAEIESLQEARRVPDPEQHVIAGAIVSIGNDGKLRIEDGLLKPEDAKRLARGEISPSKAATPRAHSAALTRRLTAHRTLALQATLVERPEVALAALTHRLILRTFFEASYFADNVVQIETQAAPFDQVAPHVEQCKAQAVMTERAAALRSMMPDDSTALFAWLLQQPQEEVLKLCAYCVARTVNGISTDEDSQALDGLAQAAGLDMREWWTPTAENYLGSIPKARILDIVREADSPQAAQALSGFKKGVLAKAAEQRLTGTGWLPNPLRGHVA